MQGAERDYPRSIDNLAAAYANATDQKHLGKVIEGLVPYKIEFLAQVCLPLIQYDELVYTWTRQHFAQAFAGITPSQGVASQLLHGSSQESAEIVRRAIGFSIENEFADTVHGVEMIVGCLAQTRKVIQDTVNVDILLTMLNCNATLEAWQKANGWTSLDLRDLFKFEKQFFGLFPKTANPLTEIYTRAMTVGGENEYTPDLMVIPTELIAMYTNGNAGGRNTYYVAGPNGVRMAQEGPLSFTSVNGMPVYAIPTLKTFANHKAAIQILREVVVCEYYVQRDLFLDADPRTRTIQDRTIKAYNENSDKMEPLSLMPGIMESNIFNTETGELNSFHDTYLSSNKENTMFTVTRDEAGNNALVRFFGQMLPGHLPQHMISHHVESAISRLPAEDSANIKFLVQTYQRMAKTPWFVGGVPRAIVNAIGDNRYDALSENNILSCGFFASWFGLELLAKKNHVYDVAVNCFSRFVSQYLTNIYTDDNPLLREDNCPGHLKNVVTHRREANVFQHLIAFDTVPLAKGATQEDPGGPPPPIRAGYENEYNNIVASFNAQYKTWRDVLDAGVALFQSLPGDVFDRFHADISRNHGDIALEFVYQYITHSLGQHNLQSDDGVNMVQRAQRFMNAMAQMYVMFAFPTDGWQGGIDPRLTILTYFAHVYELIAQHPNKTASDFYQDDDLRDQLNELIDSQEIHELNDLWVRVGTRTVRRDRNPRAAAAGPGSNPYITNAIVVTPLVVTHTMMKTGFAGALEANFQSLLPMDPSTSFVVPFPANTDESNAAVIADMESKRPARHWTSAGGDPIGFRAASHHVEQANPFASYGDTLAQLAFGNTQSRPGHFNTSGPQKRGRFQQVKGTDFYSSPVHFTSIPSFAENFEACLSVADPVHRIARGVFLHARYNLPTFQAIYACNHASIPFNVIYCRLAELRRMKGMIVMKGGESTGLTVWGRSNISVVNDGFTQTTHVSFSFWQKAIVTKPEQIQLYNNVGYDKYLGGANLSFFTAEDHATWSTKSHFMPWNRDINRNSLLVVAISPNEGALDTTLDCRGLEIEWRVGEKRINPEYTNDTYSTASYYRDVYGFKNMRPAQLGTMLFNRVPEPCAYMCQGLQHNYSGVNTWNDIVPNTGHHGVIAGPNCAATRDGRAGAPAYPNYAFSGHNQNNYPYRVSA